MVAILVLLVLKQKRWIEFIMFTNILTVSLIFHLHLSMNVLGDIIA